MANRRLNTWSDSDAADMGDIEYLCTRGGYNFLTMNEIEALKRAIAEVLAGNNVALIFCFVWARSYHGFHYWQSVSQSPFPVSGIGREFLLWLLKGLSRYPRWDTAANERFNW